MKKIFISSVVIGLESYRNAADATIRSHNHEPVGSETFGPRPYSSSVACTTEVEAADIVVLILGPHYGSIGTDGISITHQEYRTARRTNKPILALVLADEMEQAQKAFRSEVEDLTGGFFRAEIRSELDLKVALTKGLIQLQHSYSAAPESAFESRRKEAAEVGRNLLRGDDALLTLSIWSQPELGDPLTSSLSLDELFIQLSAAGITSLRAGYEPYGGSTWAGLVSKDRNQKNDL